MIKGNRELLKFENEFIRREKVDVMRNFVLVEDMFHEAVALGALPAKEKLQGIEVDMKIARVVNSV